MDRRAITIKLIEKMGRHAVDSNELFIDNLRVSHADLVGQEGDGFAHIIAGLNPERIVIAAEAVGIGKAALEKAVQYAKERVVFGRPIGHNQGIQFPLAEAYARLEAAELMTFKAAWLYDQGLPCGKEANIAKLLAGDAGCDAVDHAVQTFGGLATRASLMLSVSTARSACIRSRPSRSKWFSIILVSTSWGCLAPIDGTRAPSFGGCSALLGNVRHKS